MKKRKSFVMFTSLVIILGSVFPAFAVGSTSVVVEEAVPVIDVGLERDDIQAKEKEAKISKNKAIEIAKETLKSYFEYEIDEKKFDARIEFRDDYAIKSRYIWSIDWYMHNEQNSINIDVWIDADTGIVKRIGKKEQNDSEDSPTIAQITEEEAKTLADNFIERVNPKKYKEVKLEDDKHLKYWRYNSTDYNFTYTRQVNDVNFDGNYIAIEVDGIKGEVTSYSCRWDDIQEIPSVEDIIDKAKAQEVIQKNIDMRLSYIPYRNRYDYYEEKIKDVKLVYSPKFEKGYMVDANTGNMIDNRGKDIEEEKIKNITDERKTEIFDKAKVIEKFDKEISQERANEVIEKYVKEIYGEGYVIEQLRYVENDDYWQTSGKKSWSARFSKKNEFNGYEDSGDIAIDALTEQLISAYRFDDFEENLEEDYKAVISWEDGYDKAIEVIEKYFPDKIKSIETEAKYRTHNRYYNGKEMPEVEYYYNFTRKVNDIYYDEDRIIIVIDTKEGKIKEIRCNWNDEAKFPKAQGTISKEDAKAIFFEKHKPDLVYTKINKSNNYQNPDWEIKLVYRLSYGYIGGNIDAFTGKFLDYGGEEITEADKEFKEKIQGHEFEKELSILASQGIIDLKEFDLDKEMTRIEAIKMLVDAKGYRPHMVRKAEDLKFSNIAQEDLDYKYLQMATIYGILENKEGKFKGDEKITREELAEMMVKLLGYAELAKINDIFKVPYSDASSISEDRVGYVAICKGLDIMKDTNGEFKPKYNVTMVDMAVAIYNTLGNLR